MIKVGDRVLVTRMNDEGEVIRANPERDSYVVKGSLGTHYETSGGLKPVVAGEIVVVVVR